MLWHAEYTKSLLRAGANIGAAHVGPYWRQIIIYAPPRGLPILEKYLYVEMGWGDRWLVVCGLFWISRRFFRRFVDRSSQRKSNAGGRRTGASLFEQQQVFFQTLFQLMGRLAKSDGQVSKEEIELAKAVMQRLRLSPDAQRQAQELFNQGKASRL